ncbi:hypothetical protein [Rhodococcoides fascians]|uniref:hypothetical protein n=1 Tax=Rhodococcoides fascians TaxID=1828 RepID=UPI00117B7D1C|nr:MULTISPECIES: hypothetical protein [Rhodococcus]
MDRPPLPAQTVCKLVLLLAVFYLAGLALGGAGWVYLGAAIAILVIWAFIDRPFLHWYETRQITDTARWFVQRVRSNLR